MAAPAPEAADVGDLDDLVGLEALCFRAPKHRPWRRRELAPFLDPAHHLAAVLREGPPPDPLCGYVFFQCVADEAELLRIGVHPRARRRGYAALLLGSSLGTLGRRGVDEVVLEVRAGNHAAIGLYQRFGFRQAAQRKAYYPDGEDALILRRTSLSDPA